MKKENIEMFGCFCLGVGLTGMGLLIADIEGWFAGLFIAIGIFILIEKNSNE
ncbi:hypothetical protein ES702_04456 [subsurface metagenome]